MKPSTSLMIGIAPSLIRRVSSSAMPVLALPWRMAAYMRSSFRIQREWPASATTMLRQGEPAYHRREDEGGIHRFNLIWRKAGRPEAAHTAAFLPLEQTSRPPQTAGFFLESQSQRIC